MMMTLRLRPDGTEVNPPGAPAHACDDEARCMDRPLAASPGPARVSVDPGGCWAALDLPTGAPTAKVRSPPFAVLRWTRGMGPGDGDH
jgi:hypothetical protein